MANTIARKLRIKEGMKLLTVHAPDNFTTHLGQLPRAVVVSDNIQEYDQIHWFIKTRACMEKEKDTIIALLKADVVCWIYYPKMTSKVQTDLTRDKGWDNLLVHENLKWISLVSFDDTWSSFSIRLKSAADITKEAKPASRPILEFIDAVAKTVRLPADFEKSLHESQSAGTCFNKLPFSHKKEYLEWIITAKREETKRQRIKSTVEKLEIKSKNP